MTDAKCNPAELKKGDVVSTHVYYTVTKDVGPNDKSVCLQDDDGNPEIVVSKNIVERENYTAGQFQSEEKVTRSELVRQLGDVRDSVFEVAYNKQATAKDVVDAMNAHTDKKQREKAVREAMKGQRRVLYGYMVEMDNGMGRSVVIDMGLGGVSKASRTRQVDHRSLEYLICRGKKYVAK